MKKSLSLLAGLLVAPLVLTGCGKSGSSGSNSGGGTNNAAQGAVCQGSSGDQLVVLKDDKSSQKLDAIVPIVRKDAAKPPLTTALNNVTASLTQDKLVALNKAVSTNNQRPEDAAKDYVQANNLTAGLSGGSGPITVAAANFSESQALANVFAQTLNAAGYTATVKVIGARALYEPAVESGQAQVVPEYVASLTSYLATKDNTPNITATGEIGSSMQALNQLLAKRPLVALNPANATDEVAFAVSSGSVQKYGLKTLSDVATKCPGGLTLGGPPECHTRPDCQGGLETTYGLKITNYVTLDEDGPTTRSSLQQGKVFMAEVFSADPDLVPAS